MNNVGGALNFNATLNLNEWRRNVDQIRRDIVGLNQSTKKTTNEMDAAFKRLSVGIASYFTIHMVKDFINELITVRGEFQQMENAIETITGSTSQMNKLMDEWKELTLRSPFRLSEIGQAGKQLLAYGIDVNKVTHDIEMLANVASGVSGNIGDIAYVYGTLKTQGRAYTRDILQFTMRGIPLMDELAKVMNVNVSELKGLIEAGKVGFPEVEKAMNRLTSEGGKFNNLIAKQATTLTGSVNRLKHEFELMLNEIGTNNENILKGGIDAVTHLIENYQEVGKVLLTLVEIYGIYRTALLVTAAIQKASIAMEAIKIWISLARSIKTAADAQALFNLTSKANPYTLIITVIGALIAITYNYRQELGELTGLIEEQTNSQKAQEEVMSEYHRNFAKGVNETKANISELISIINNESSTLEMRKAAYEKLIKIDQTFIGVLDGQYKATNRLGQALEFVTSKIDAFAMAQAKAAASRKILEQSFEERFKRDALKVQADSAQKEADKWKKMDEEARKAGKASLEYMRNAYDAEKRRDKLLGQLEKQRKIANEKTGISNTIIRSNQQEINQKTKVLRQLEQEVKLGKLNGEQLELKKKQIEKLAFELNGFKPQIIQSPEEIKKSEGWAERIKAQIEELEAQAQKAPTQAAYQAIRNRIDKLNELLNPKKNKQENQLAEILPEGSIKELERRAQLLNDAIDTAVNGVVKLRKLDKFGHDKDKKGNPYLTGETVSTEEAYKRLQQIQDEIDSKRYKSNKDRLDETKTQFENYYSIASYYGKEIADKQYAPLVSKSKNYLKYVDNEVKLLETRLETGEKLSKSDQEYLVMLRKEMDSLNGFEEPIEVFKREFENTLKLMPSYVDQLGAIDNAIDEIFRKSGGSNMGLYLSQKKYLEETKRGVLQQQKDLYTQFIVGQETFEEKKLQIERKYNNIRAQMGENTTLSDTERLRLLDAAGKAEAKEYRDAFVSVLEKSDMFEKVFGNIDALTKKEISKYIPELEAKINELINLGAPAQEVEKFREKLEKLKDVSKDSGPIKRLIDSFKELRKKIREGTATQEDFNRLNQHIQETKFYTDLAINSAKELSEALGIDGKGGPFEKFAKDLTQTIEGLINALVGYFSGNIQQMVGGIAQMVVGIVKMLSTAGDGKKEKSIREWKRAVDELKASYEELQHVIEKTAGEAQLTKQRELISNLKEQQNLLIQMRDKESQKKKKDVDKIASYNQQINDVNIKIQEIADNFQKSVTTTDFKDLSQKLADALVSAFGQGEDAAKAFDKVVDDVMKNAVVNALKIKYLEPVVQEMIDKLYSSLGYGKGDTADKFAQIKQYEEEIRKLDEKMKNNVWGSLTNGQYEAEKKKYLQLIDNLKAEIAKSDIAGSFDGLTQDEIDKLKDYKNDPRYKAFLESIKTIDQVFENTTAAAQGLKGDIKGITEKTAGALEGQINAMRINVAEALKIHRENQNVFKNQLIQLTQIESNTRNLVQMRKDLSELNSKVKNSLAGIP